MNLKSFIVWVAITLTNIFLFLNILVKSLNKPTTPKNTSVSISPATVPEIADTIEPDEYVHDFTECCKYLNVSNKCLGFCTIHKYENEVKNHIKKFQLKLLINQSVLYIFISNLSIIDGTAGVEPDMCESDFPRIVKCMADGRNHLPCCERKKIPDVCQVKKNLLPLNDLLANPFTEKYYKIRICAKVSIHRLLIMYDHEFHVWHIHYRH